MYVYSFKAFMMLSVTCIRIYRHNHLFIYFFLEIFLVQLDVFSEVSHFDYRASPPSDVIDPFLSICSTDRCGYWPDSCEVCVGFLVCVRACVCVCRLCFSVQAVLLNVLEPVSDLFSECSGEHCVLCEAGWVLLMLMPCCPHRQETDSGTARLCEVCLSGSSRWEVSKTARLPAHALTEMWSGIQNWSRAAANGYFNYWLMYYYCLTAPWII